MTLALGLALVVAGISLVAAAVRPARALRYLASVSPQPVRERRRWAGPAARWFHRVLPPPRLGRIEARLDGAGRPLALSAAEVVAAQVVLAVLATAGSALWVLAARPRGGLALAGVACALAGAVLAPPAWIARRIRSRQDAVRRDLPTVLDLLAISVEAGLGFDGALGLAARDCRGPLGDEIRRVLREMELGSPRREALTGLKRRVAIPELSSFVVAVTQADVLGMPIGRVLHVQAGELRARRRQWARERAAKLPIKILFPLVVFIFPAILVVLLGPAGASIWRALA